MKDIVIIGAGDFGKEVAWLIDDINSAKAIYNILGYVDDNENLHGCYINGYKVIGNSDYLNKIAEQNELHSVISIQNGDVKKLLASKISNVKWETIIHPSVIMSKYVKVGKGTIVTAGNIVSTNVVIGDHCLLNLACTIGHDCIIEDYVCIMPGCNFSGYTLLKEGCWIGTGVKIIPKKTIESGSIIGAGAVVIKDIIEPGTYAGVPARKIKAE